MLFMILFLLRLCRWKQPGTIKQVIDGSLVSERSYLKQVCANFIIDYCAPNYWDKIIDDDDIELTSLLFVAPPNRTSSPYPNFMDFVNLVKFVQGNC